LATVTESLRQGNRRGPRRDKDQLGYYVDRYEPRLLYVALGIVVLSAMDAVLTLNLLSMGASEVNPFMALLMNVDMGLFALIKMAITVIGVLILVVHVKFRLFKILQTGLVLYGIFPAYVCLVFYELTLLAIHS